MNLKHLFVGCLILMVSFGCDSSERPPKPNNLIPKDKMVSVLYDMFIVNSAKGINRKLLENNGVMPEDYILNKFEIDSAQFANSNTFYAYDLEEYQSIMEEVKERITKSRDSLKELEEKEKENAQRIKDSIKKSLPQKPLKSKDSNDLGLEELMD